MNCVNLRLQQLCSVAREQLSGESYARARCGRLTHNLSELSLDDAMYLVGTRSGDCDGCHLTRKGSMFLRFVRAHLPAPAIPPLGET